MRIGIISVPEDLLPAGFWGNKPAKITPVKQPEQAAQIDGLLLAGNDVFALHSYLTENNLIGFLQTQIQKGMPVWGMGAGLYLMAKTKKDRVLASLDVMDVVAEREVSGGRYFAPLYIQAFGFEPVRAVFHRPAYITQVEPQVGIMAYYRDKIIMARQGNMLASAFFTEKGETRPSAYFLQMVEDNFE